MNASTRRRLSFAASGAVALVFVALLWRASASALAPKLHTIDLNAFYCGGKIFGAGLDP